MDINTALANVTQTHAALASSGDVRNLRAEILRSVGIENFNLSYPKDGDSATYLLALAGITSPLDDYSGRILAAAGGSWDTYFQMAKRQLEINPDAEARLNQVYPWIREAVLQRIGPVTTYADRQAATAQSAVDRGIYTTEEAAEFVAAQTEPSRSYETPEVRFFVDGEQVTQEEAVGSYEEETLAAVTGSGCASGGCPTEATDPAGDGGAWADGADQLLQDDAAGAGDTSWMSSGDGYATPDTTAASPEAAAGVEASVSFSLGTIIWLVLVALAAYWYLHK